MSESLFQPQWNLYNIHDNDNEHELYKSVIGEFNDIAGFPVLYFELDVTNGKFDPLYGEMSNMKYNEPKLTRLIYEPESEPRILSTFGLSIDDTMQYMLIPKDTYKRDVSELEPKPGDVVKTLWNNRNYEIVDVGQTSNIFKGKRHVWSFTCKTYRYSEESVSTKDIYEDTFSAPVWDDKLWSDESTLMSIDEKGFSNTLPPSATGEDNGNIIDGSSSSYRDNIFIQEESDESDVYRDKDTRIYGY